MGLTAASPSGGPSADRIGVKARLPAPTSQRLPPPRQPHQRHLAHANLTEAMLYLVRARSWLLLLGAPKAYGGIISSGDGYSSVWLREAPDRADEENPDRLVADMLSRARGVKLKAS